MIATSQLLQETATVISDCTEIESEPKFSAD